MKRKRIIITGATSGIGLETLKRLATNQYEVIIACRNPQKMKAVITNIKSLNEDAIIHGYVLDLSSFSNIKKFSEKIYRDFKYIDVLFNNAGIFIDSGGKTKDGFELTIGVNYIGTFYLTYLLKDIISKGNNPQIIHVNSRASLFGHLTYKKGRFKTHPKGFRAYAASKYMQMLWVYFSADEFLKAGIRMNAIHPGDVMTNLWHTKNFLIKLIWPMLKRTLITVQEGAGAGIFLIENNFGAFGKLFQKEGEEMPIKKYNEEKAKKLVNYTKLVLSKSGYPI